MYIRKIEHREAETESDPAHAAALRRLHRRRGLQAHALSYVTVNVLLVVLWWFFTPAVFFWPLLAVLGWGIGLLFHAWAVYSPSTIDQARVDDELARMQGHDPRAD